MSISILFTFAAVVAVAVSGQWPPPSSPDLCEGTTLKDALRAGFRALRPTTDHVRHKNELFLSLFLFKFTNFRGISLRFAVYIYFLLRN